MVPIGQIAFWIDNDRLTFLKCTLSACKMRKGFEHDKHMRSMVDLVCNLTCGRTICVFVV